jgi:hypothetical protein
VNETDQRVIRAAIWIETFLSQCPRWLLKMIVPSACRENFFTAVRDYKLMNDQTAYL